MWTRARRRTVRAGQPSERQLQVAVAAALGCDDCLDDHVADAGVGLQGCHADVVGVAAASERTAAGVRVERRDELVVLAFADHPEDAAAATLHDAAISEARESLAALPDSARADGDRAADDG